MIGNVFIRQTTVEMECVNFCDQTGCNCKIWHSSRKKTQFPLAHMSISGIVQLYDETILPLHRVMELAPRLAWATPAIMTPAHGNNIAIVWSHSMWLILATKRTGHRWMPLNPRFHCLKSLGEARMPRLEYDPYFFTSPVGLYVYRFF